MEPLLTREELAYAWVIPGARSSVPAAPSEPAAVGGRDGTRAAMMQAAGGRRRTRVTDEVHRRNEAAPRTRGGRRGARLRGRLRDRRRSPLVASGCAASSSGTAASPSPSPSPTLSAAHVTITPGNGARQAKPHKGITVTVRDGTLASVTARERRRHRRRRARRTTTTVAEPLDALDRQAVRRPRHGGRRRRPEHHQDRAASAPSSPTPIATSRSSRGTTSPTGSACR